MCVADFAGLWYSGNAALLHSGSRGEVEMLEILISFLVSVAAGIISYYVCKWLDRRSKGK
jgi:hypothetical protein